MLEEEVYSQNSPIWDQDFLSASSRTSQLGIQTGKSFFYINQRTTRKCYSQLTLHLFVFFIKKLKTGASKKVNTGKFCICISINEESRCKSNRQNNYYFYYWVCLACTLQFFGSCKIPGSSAL